MGVEFIIISLFFSHLLAFVIGWRMCYKSNVEEINKPKNDQKL